MIGLDTNVLIRYIALDDPLQTPKAERVIDSLTAENLGFISLVVVAEVAWVLKRSYHYKNAEIASVLQTLLGSQELIMEQTELVADALRRFSVGDADFADFLIERSGRATECEYTVTFDKRAVSAGMRLLA
jgi:predicted nucleic-acid-binding protein